MLVDRLEAVINSGSRVPLSNRVVVDEREALDVLDLMRTTVPEEIKQARRVNQEREKILAQAQSDAHSLVSQAQDRVERLLSEESIRVQAEDQAREILANARQEAEEVRRGADDYALDMLDRLEGELHRIQGSVRNAINALSNESSSIDRDDRP